MSTLVNTSPILTAPVLTAIGLMSGTSLDGVDAAVLATDGERILAFGPRRYRPYSETERSVLRAALAEGRNLTDRNARPGVLAAAERLVTEAHAEAVETLMAENSLASSAPELAPRGAPDLARVHLVGFHGQTVLHAPARGLTVQIGEGEALAKRLGIPVVYDFRAADLAAGGEGAPLVPAYHRALVARAGLTPPVAIVNIGGVANLTRIGADGAGDGEMTAFDTGPGNALLDDFIRSRTGDLMDRDGRVSAAGTPDEAILREWLGHAHFRRPPPKSLDRNAFSANAVADLSTEDGAATLAAFTARSIAAGLRQAGGAARVVLAGGGAHNPTLRRMIATAVGIPVDLASDHGWSADFLEAEAFAFLAVRSFQCRPLSFPGTTGVLAPAPGGVLARPPAATRNRRASIV